MVKCLTYFHSFSHVALHFSAAAKKLLPGLESMSLFCSINRYKGTFYPFEEKVQKEDKKGFQIPKWSINPPINPREENYLLSLNIFLFSLLIIIISVLDLTERFNLIFEIPKPTWLFLFLIIWNVQIPISFRISFSSKLVGWDLWTILAALND